MNTRRHGDLEKQVPSHLVKEETFQKVREQVARPPLTHLFDYSLDTTEAQSFWPDMDDYRRDTIMVYRATGKALLLVLELSEQTSKPYFDGSQAKPQSLWTARFVAGFPQTATEQHVRAFGDLTYENTLRGGMTSATFDDFGTCTTASYSY